MKISDEKHNEKFKTCPTKTMNYREIRVNEF